MKQPKTALKRPRQPKKPIKPQPPAKTILKRREVPIDSYTPLIVLLNKIGAKTAAGVYVEKEVYGHRYLLVCTHEMPDPDYDTKYAKYTKALARFQEDELNYPSKMEEYRKNFERWQLWYLADQTERLERDKRRLEEELARVRTKLDNLEKTNGEVRSGPVTS